MLFLGGDVMKPILDRQEKSSWQIRPFLLPIICFYQKQIKELAKESGLNYFALTQSFIECLNNNRFEVIYRIPIADLIELESYDNANDFYDRFDELLRNNRISPNDVFIMKQIAILTYKDEKKRVDQNVH